MITFLVTVITILGLLHWFLYARLVSALELTSPAVLWPLRLLAVFLALSYLIARSISDLPRKRWCMPCTGSPRCGWG